MMNYTQSKQSMYFYEITNRFDEPTKATDSGGYLPSSEFEWQNCIGTHGMVPLYSRYSNHEYIQEAAAAHTYQRWRLFCFPPIIEHLLIFLIFSGYNLTRISYEYSKWLSQISRHTVPHIVAQQVYFYPKFCLFQSHLTSLSSEYFRSRYTTAYSQPSSVTRPPSNRVLSRYRVLPRLLDRSICQLLQNDKRFQGSSTFKRSRPRMRT